MDDFKQPKPILLRWYMLHGYQEKNINPNIISHGIWETIEVQVNEGKDDLWTLRCILPMHEDLKVGDKRKMYGSMLVTWCTRVELVEHNLERENAKSYYFEVLKKQNK